MLYFYFLSEHMIAITFLLPFSTLRKKTPSMGFPWIRPLVFCSRHRDRTLARTFFVKLLKLCWQTLILDLWVRFALLQRREGFRSSFTWSRDHVIRHTGCWSSDAFRNTFLCVFVSRRVEALFVMGDVRLQRTFGTVRLMSKLRIVPLFFLNLINIAPRTIHDIEILRTTPFTQALENVWRDYSVALFGKILVCNYYAG